MPDSDTLEPVTFELTASELPESIRMRLRGKPAAGTRFTITVEPSLSEEEKLEALRREIDLGLADLDAGRSVDGAAVFADLKKRFPAL
jgi:hypothetical protein